MGGSGRGRMRLALKEEREDGKKEGRKWILGLRLFGVIGGGEKKGRKGETRVRERRKGRKGERKWMLVLK